MALESYSTTALESPDRAAQWSSIIAETYFPLHLRFRDPARFQGRLERRVSGLASLSRLCTEAAEYERVPSHIRYSQAEEYLVTIPCTAAVRFRQAGREVRCEPGSFILERGDEPYRFSYDNPSDLYVMKISRQALAERMRQPDRLCARIFDGREGMGGLFVETVRRAHRMRTEDGADQVLGRHLVELLALAIDRQAETDAPAQSVVREAHLRRAEEMIRRRLTDPGLSPETIAEGCGISKRYLHALFADTDRTVAQYIRDQRLLAARDLLELPGALSMAEIAYRFGFSDQASFSRQFRAMFGQTPTGFRAASRVRTPAA